MNEVPDKVLLRYYGGKWKLAEWIIQHFPPHQMYVEPFGGGASVLLRKSRSYHEVYNDLDDRVVNLFRVLRDPELGPELKRQLELTPFSRKELDLAYPKSEDPVEDARRVLVLSLQGYGSDSVTRGHRTGFRIRKAATGPSLANDWSKHVDSMDQYLQRMRGVTVESVPALECIERYDESTTLFYVDPPYLTMKRNRYKYGMSADDHRDLADVLHKAKGMVVLSGDECELYEELFGDWLLVRRHAVTQTGTRKIEALWISPSTASKLNGNLFTEAA